MDSNERVPFFSIPNNMILTRILSSIAYNIHFDFGLQNSVFFTVKTPITFLFFFRSWSFAAIFPYDYATTSKKHIDLSDGKLPPKINKSNSFSFILWTPQYLHFKMGCNKIWEFLDLCFQPHFLNSMSPSPMKRFLIYTILSNERRKNLLSGSAGRQKHPFHVKNMY